CLLHVLRAAAVDLYDVAGEVDPGPAVVLDRDGEHTARPDRQETHPVRPGRGLQVQDPPFVAERTHPLGDPLVCRVGAPVLAFDPAGAHPFQRRYPGTVDDLVLSRILVGDRIKCWSGTRV